MAGAYSKNAPRKTNWEVTGLDTYGNQANRKTKTAMASGWHGRSKKVESQKLERKQLTTEKFGQTWLRRRKPTKGCSAK
jgi:hypothetical protein